MLRSVCCLYNLRAYFRDDSNFEFEQPSEPYQNVALVIGNEKVHACKEVVIYSSGSGKNYSQNTMFLFVFFLLSQLRRRVMGEDNRKNIFSFSQSTRPSLNQCSLGSTMNKARRKSRWMMSIQRLVSSFLSAKNWMNCRALENVSKMLASELSFSQEEWRGRRQGRSLAASRLHYPFSNALYGK